MAFLLKITEIEETAIAAEELDFFIWKDRELDAVFIMLDRESERIKDLVEALTISTIIKSFPSNELKKMAWTKDLEERWLAERANNYWLALRLLFKTTGIESSFKKVIDKDLINELQEWRAEQYINLWEMIKLGFSSIKKDISKCPKTPEELFKEIVKTELDALFFVLLENNYVEYCPSLLAKIFEERKKLSKNINWEKINKLKARVPGMPTNYFNSGIVSETFKAIRKKAKKDYKLRCAAKKYDTSVKRICEVMFSLYSHRNNKGKLIPTVIWKDGIFDAKSWGREAPSHR